MRRKQQSVRTYSSIDVIPREGPVRFPLGGWIEGRSRVGTENAGIRGHHVDDDEIYSVNDYHRRQ